MIKKPKSTKKIKHTIGSKKAPKIIERDKSSTISPWIDDYIGCFGMKIKPVTEAFLERVAEELVEWAMKEDSIYLEDFCILKGFNIDVLYRWREKSINLKEAYKFAKMALGSKTYKGSLYGKMKENTAHFLMPHYSEIWMNMKLLNSHLKDNQNAPTQITVNMTPF